MSSINISKLKIVEARTQLELCLDMMEEVQQHLDFKDYRVAQQLVSQILGTFGRDFCWETVEEDLETSIIAGNNVTKLAHH